MADGRAITMYGRPLCPQVRPCRGLLDRAGAAYTYIDISQDVAGRETVRALNDGYESVPTLVFPDGSSLTEPSGAVLKAKLEAFDYEVRRPTLWESVRERPWLLIWALFALLFGVSDGQPLFVAIGLALVGIVLVGRWWRGY